MEVLDRPPTLDVLVGALRPLLRSGLPATPDNSPDELLALRGVFARAVDPDDRLHRIKALDGLLRSQLVHFEDDTQSEAARVLFGLTPGTRGTSLTQRRSRAADELHCNEEHFRKRIEPKIVKQLAWQLHQDTQTYVPRARDVPPPLEISGDTPRITKGDVSSKERAEHEELLSRLWAHVYALRAEILRVERLKHWPYDETEPKLSQEHFDRALESRHRQVNYVKRYVAQYIERYGTTLMHGEGEFNAQALLRLAGWAEKEFDAPEQIQTPL